ncbi:siderophore-interacting protein [Tropicimonas sp.]|uniref:siderophore-interacting protein n=1 Tax=Tropicimonas sp. TaxID=2067044 RepID=UPI003A84F2E3
MPEVSAILRAGHVPVFAAVEEIAYRNGVAVARDNSRLTVTSPLGSVHFTAEGQATHLRFEAITPADLQVLRDRYAERFEQLGVTNLLDWQAGSAGVPLNQMLARVVRCERISPNFARLRLEGDFSAFAQPGAGLHFRLLFSRVGAEWPYLDASGIMQWPNGIGDWHRPPYTVRALDPAAQWMDVDIVVHPGGRVTDWCGTVAPGNEIALHGPGGNRQPKAGWLGLAGDETALPVILRMVENAPAGTAGHAIVWLRDLADAQPVETASAIRMEWRAAEILQDPVLLLAEFHPPAADRHLFFAGERELAGRARQWFRENGYSGGEAKAAAYWTDGWVPPW